MSADDEGYVTIKIVKNLAIPGWEFEGIRFPTMLPDNGPPTMLHEALSLVKDAIQLVAERLPGGPYEIEYVL